MVSTVGARPNYYEMLGLTPAATGDEIAKAFAREMGMLRVRPIGAAAVISIAFETLRNPAKRRAYDESIGLARKPEPAVAPMPALRFAGSARWDSMVRPAADLPPPPPPPASAPPRPDAAFEQRLASIAASVRELAKPPATEAPPPRPQPERARSPEAAGAPRLEPRTTDLPAPGDIDAEASPDAAAGPFEWKRAGLAAGGLIVAAALVGAWAGVSAGGEAEAQEPEQAVTLTVPPAKSAPAASLSALEPASAVAEAQPERRPRIAAAARRERRAPTAQPQRGLSDQELEELVPVDVSRKASDAVVGAAEQTAAAASTVAPTPAKLPLSNATIARTIGRIGYSCGRVSTVAEGDGPGVFNVTCTSGQSYRAAPVRGRYHFRRLGGR